MMNLAQNIFGINVSYVPKVLRLDALVLSLCTYLASSSDEP
jgi:hypothetical protein